MKYIAFVLAFILFSIVIPAIIGLSFNSSAMNIYKGFHNIIVAPGNVFFSNPKGILILASIMTSLIFWLSILLYIWTRYMRL